MTINLAIFTPNLGAKSETFIHNHIQMLAPGHTVVISGSLYDTSWLDAPVLRIQSYQKYLLKKVRDTIRTFRLFSIIQRIFEKKLSKSSLPGHYSSKNERDVTMFLRQHHVTHILVEYGCVGTEIVELNARLLHLPLFVHFHGFDASESLRDPKIVEYYRWMGQNVSGIIVVSQSMGKRLVEIGIPEDKIHLVHIGTPLINEPQAQPEIQPCRFINVGRLVPKKAPILLLQAFAKTLASVPDATLDMIGDGDLHAEVERFIHDNRLELAVHWWKAQPHDFVINTMARSSVYVQHSVVDPQTGDAEGLPVGILEACASCLPVVSTFHEGIPEAVEHNISGFLVNEFDVDGMAEYMVKLALDPELRKQMGLVGHNKICAEYNLINQIERLRRAIGISGMPEAEMIR